MERAFSLAKGKLRSVSFVVCLPLILGRSVLGQLPSPSFDQPKASSDSVADTREAGERPVSRKLLITNTLKDPKAIWSFPVQVAQGKHLKPTLAVALGTAAFVAMDPHDTPYFRSRNFDDFKTGPLRGRNTALGATLIPACIYLVGLARKDSYAQHTALLAAEGIADSQILGFFVKAVTWRDHPSDIPPNGDFTHTWFKYRSHRLNGKITNLGSFPSGHALTAFAVATVLAERYHQHRWVPWLGYGLASVAALSRIPDQAHFPSDVFAGAVMGSAIGHYVVLRR